MVGKKPSNRVKHSVSSNSSTHRTTTKSKEINNPSRIRNKLKRSEMYGKYLQERNAKKKEERKKRERTALALGENEDDNQETTTNNHNNNNNNNIKSIPKTLDNTREWEATMVSADDDEVEADHQDDEFQDYFQDTIRPKLLLTTRPKPSQQVFYFIADLQNLIPSLHYYPRQSFSLKEICQFATNRGFTHLIVLGERHKECNGMTISHLRPNHSNDESTASSSSSPSTGAGGPTAFFKVSNVVTSQRIPKHGTPTDHIPELNLHGFVTRLGQRVGRFLGSIFPHNAEFQGRQVVTFHNQRDYIFVRQHRYVFYDSQPTTTHKNNSQTTNATTTTTTTTHKTRARLQELGPRFTLKLKWIQEGTFDTQFGEYEWYHKRKEMDITRRRFHL
jgi:ribosome production factor 1